MLKEKIDSDRLKGAMLFGTGVELLQILVDTIVDYEKRGIDVVPVSTLKDMIGEANMRNLTRGFAHHMITEYDVED